VVRKGGGEVKGGKEGGEAGDGGSGGGGGWVWLFRNAFYSEVLWCRPLGFGRRIPRIAPSEDTKKFSFVRGGGEGEKPFANKPNPFSQLKEETRFPGKDLRRLRREKDSWPFHWGERHSIFLEVQNPSPKYRMKGRKRAFTNKEVFS